VLTYQSHTMAGRAERAPTVAVRLFPSGTGMCTAAMQKNIPRVKIHDDLGAVYRAFSMDPDFGVLGLSGTSRRFDQADLREAAVLDEAARDDELSLVLPRHVTTCPNCFRLNQERRGSCFECRKPLRG
jgi:hypothetical protein